MRGLSPPYEWGDKALMGGLMRGDIDLMGGPNFDRLYHKLKVLLLLSCNNRMHFVGYYNNNQWCSVVYRVLDQQRLF